MSRVPGRFGPRAFSAAFVRGVGGNSVVPHDACFSRRKAPSREVNNLDVVSSDRDDRRTRTKTRRRRTRDAHGTGRPTRPTLGANDTVVRTTTTRYAGVSTRNDKTGFRQSAPLGVQRNNRYDHTATCLSSYTRVHVGGALTTFSRSGRSVDISRAGG